MFDALGRIKELRESRGWSVYHLSKLSGIPQSTIATWYRKGLCPPIDKLEIICSAFGISLAEFFYEKRDYDLDQEYKTLIYKWRLLTKEQQAIINKLMDQFLRG